MTTEKRDEALERAILSVGGTAALTRFINEKAPADERLTTQAVSQWKRCPDRRVLIVERATVEIGKRKVSRHDLRRDLYPRERQAA